MEINNNTTEMEQGFMDNEFEGVETEMVETTEMDITKKDVFNGFLVGLGTGTLLGGTAGITAWIIERRKRMAILRQLEHVVDSAKALILNPEAKEVEIRSSRKKNKKKEIAAIDLKDAEGLLISINKELGNIKIRKKEREQWELVFKELLDLVKKVAVHDVEMRTEEV